MIGALYDLAHAAFVAGIVGAIVGGLWLGWWLVRNYRVRHNPEYGRSRRKRRLRWPAGLLAGAVVLIVVAGYIGQTRVVETTVGAMVNQGRTHGEAGLRTEAEVFGTTVSTLVYFKPLPGSSPADQLINRLSRDLVHTRTNVDAQVGVYGSLDFSRVLGAKALIDASRRTITVELPAPVEKTEIYSVHGVSVSQGLLSAAVTAVKSLLTSLVGKPFVSADISGELKAAEKKAAARADPAEVYGCGRVEMEQQLAGIFGVLVSKYRGWSVRVEFPGMRTAPDSTCVGLQKRLRASLQAVPGPGRWWRQGPAKGMHSLDFFIIMLYNVCHLVGSLILTDVGVP